MAATYAAETALRYAVFGNAFEARRHAAAAVRISTGENVDCAAGLALAFAGDAFPVRALAKDLAKRFPEDTIVRFISCRR